MFENVMKLSTTSCNDDCPPFKVINWEKKTFTLTFIN